MKNATRLALFLLTILIALSFAACADAAVTDPWESAIYTSDTELGEGAKTVQVEVKAEDRSLTFTIRTDRDLLGDALREHELIESDDGLILTLNGIEADWNDGGWWWKFTKDGVTMSEGADTTSIADGDHYEFTRTNSFD